jgi:intracellular multiplication protein IcmD
MAKQRSTIQKLLVLSGLLLLSQGVSADTAAASGIGGIATNITAQASGLIQLIISIAYVAGIGFGVASIFKFKQHKDNPTQVPIGTPVTMLMISAALVFMPSLYKPLGETLFGTSADKAGGATGAGASNIPGFSSGS